MFSKCHDLIFRWKGQTFLLIYAGLLQSFSVHKSHPFLTIEHKLTFRSASIQSTTNSLNQVPVLFYFYLTLIMFVAQKVLVLLLHHLHLVVGFPESQLHLDVLHYLHAALDPRIAVHPHLHHLEAVLGLHPLCLLLSRHHSPATVTSHLLHLWVVVHRLHLHPHLPHHLLQPVTSPVALANQHHLLLLLLVVEDEEPYWMKFAVDVR